jgi:hypothetical protein
MDPGSIRSWRRRTVAFVLAGAMAMVTMAPGPIAARSADFLESLRHSAVYHRALASLPLRYLGQPDAAAEEFERLTSTAMEKQFAVDVGPCFARWWAYEYMGLELTALSLELRRTHTGYAETADTLERLGTRMWVNAMALLPRAAEACGVERRPVVSISAS